MTILSQLRVALRAQANPEKAKVLQRFFKTGKGEYAEGDIFLGVTVPQCRAIVSLREIPRRGTKEYCDLSFKDIKQLLPSKIHEERLLALLILVQCFIESDTYVMRDKNARPSKLVPQRKIIDFYLAHTRHVNNWDLVDLSAPKILGASIFRGSTSKSLLTRLAKSQNLWERRIAIVATLYLIQHDQFTETLRIARILLNDPHDLIHKAVGWMLREVGKRDFKVEARFVRKYGSTMPRTMLRYAIERWPEKARKEVMQ